MSLQTPTGDILLKSVLLATDFSQASQKAMRHAVAIAHHYGAKFYLVHVVCSPAFSMVGPDAVVAATEAAGRDARLIESDLVATGALTGLRHEVIACHGDVIEELDEIISREQVDLVVVGTHARRGVGKLLLGSVAEHIFRHCKGLVLTVGPGSLQDSPAEGSRPVRPFLFATDFSESSIEALPYAISSANHFGTKLVLLHVISAVPFPQGMTQASPEDIVEIRERARRESLDRLRKLATQDCKLTLEAEFMVEFGNPSDQILATASALKTDTIILGLHPSPHAQTKSHMPWATAYEVACGACCSVLTMRA